MTVTPKQLIAPSFLPTAISSPLYTTTTLTQLTSIILSNVTSDNSNCSYTLYVGGSGLNNAIFGNNVTVAPGEVVNYMMAVTLPSGTNIYGTATTISGICIHMSGVEYTE